MQSLECGSNMYDEETGELKRGPSKPKQFSGSSTPVVKRVTGWLLSIPFKKRYIAGLLILVMVLAAVLNYIFYLLTSPGVSLAGMSKVASYKGIRISTPSLPLHPFTPLYIQKKTN